jgi:hypothetical protein
VSGKKQNVDLLDWLSVNRLIQWFYLNVMKYKLILFVGILFAPLQSQAQVLISLVFGEVLNTDKVEFGLSGGMNRSYIYSIGESEGMNNFDLGFYFHILLKNSSYISTGVHVKSNVGATGMTPYPLGNNSVDSIYKDGTLTRKIPCFYVPILFHQRFNNRWYVEAGPQLGLIHQSSDVFEVSALDGDFEYKRDVQDQMKHIDAGLMGVVGYKFLPQIKSMSAGVGYYHGLVNVSKNPDVTIKNSSLYFFIKIPIGAGDSSQEKDK